MEMYTPDLILPVSSGQMHLQMMHSDRIVVD